MDRQSARLIYGIDGTEIVKTGKLVPQDHKDIAMLIKAKGQTEKLTLGETYSLDGYNWTCAEEIDGGYVLQSQGVTCGLWPGYKTTKFGNGSYYGSNIDGQDISDYDTKMQSLYNLIQSAEKTGVSYGLGLFLVSNAKVGTTTAGQGSGYYWSALKTAATNYTWFGGSGYHAWLGTVAGSGSAWVVNQNGTVENTFAQVNSPVVAPAFNIDASKIYLEGNEIKIIGSKSGCISYYHDCMYQTVEDANGKLSAELIWQKIGKDKNLKDLVFQDWTFIRLNTGNYKNTRLSYTKQSDYVYLNGTRSWRTWPAAFLISNIPINANKYSKLKLDVACYTYYNAWITFLYTRQKYYSREVYNSEHKSPYEHAGVNDAHNLLTYSSGASAKTYDREWVTLDITNVIGDIYIGFFLSVGYDHISEAYVKLYDIELSN